MQLPVFFECFCGDLENAKLLFFNLWLLNLGMPQFDGSSLFIVPPDRKILKSIETEVL